MIQAVPHPMNALMAQVGYVLLYWGFLEAVHQQTGEWHIPESATEFERVKRIRNLVAHGIVSADASESDAFIRCVDEKGAQAQLPQSELADAAQSIDRIRRELLVGHPLAKS